MADSSAPTITINIKGPSELKLSLSVQTDIFVLDLKRRIESEKSDFPAERCACSPIESALQAAVKFWTSPTRRRLRC